MHIIKKLFFLRKRISFLLLVFLCLLSCQPEDLPPNISEISKSEREQLGDQILIYLEDFHESCFLMCEEDYPFVFDYLQKLYDHASFFIKEDIHSISSNRWDKNRQWKVLIVNQPAVKAFCLPAGHIVLSSGLLKRIKYEYELFYIMNFEIALMNEKYLLNALVEITKNPQPILEVAAGRSTSVADRELLGRALSRISYGDENSSIKKLDSLTCKHICKHSIFSNQGLRSLIPNKISEDDVWLSTRPSYDLRREYIAKFGNSNPSFNCSSKKWGAKGHRFFRDSIIARLP